MGGSLDDFLREEGIYEEVVSEATKEFIAWQLQQKMSEQEISKSEMARRIGTSRAQLDRLLNPNNTNVQLSTLMRAAEAVGRRLRVELV
jgi:DNA-binding Xre family transcriptional regulator